MKFVVIVVALVLDQLLRPFEHLRAHRWYEEPLGRLQQWANDHGPGTEFLTPVVFPLVIAFAVGGVAWGLASFSLFLGFLFALLVLVFCLGPRDIATQVAAYVRARASGEDEKAALAAQLLLNAEPPEDDVECAEALTESVLSKAGDRLFTVIFWFAILGPLGAALWRVVQATSECALESDAKSSYFQVIWRFRSLMAWLPSHLLALTYALAGSFDEAMADVRRCYQEMEAHFLELDSAILVFAGRGALRRVAGDQPDPVASMHAAVDLIWRSLVIWMAVLGLITLIGWLI